jgi:putative SOS response-associated peptidase YedK
MSCGGVDAQMRPVMLEMRPAPEDVLRMWLIDKKVGNVRNDGPDLLEPQPVTEPELDLPAAPASG